MTIQEQINLTAQEIREVKAHIRELETARDEHDCKTPAQHCYLHADISTEIEKQKIILDNKYIAKKELEAIAEDVEWQRRIDRDENFIRQHKEHTHGL